MNYLKENNDGINSSEFKPYIGPNIFLLIYFLIAGFFFFGNFGFLEKTISLWITFLFTTIGIIHYTLKIKYEILDKSKWIIAGIAIAIFLLFTIMTHYGLTSNENKTQYPIISDTLTIRYDTSRILKTKPEVSYSGNPKIDTRKNSIIHNDNRTGNIVAEHLTINQAPPTRRLTKEQTDTLILLLSMLPPDTVYFASTYGDNEANDYIEEIRSVFLNSNWHVTPIETHINSRYSGALILISSISDTSRIILYTQKIFRYVGIEMPVQIEPNTQKHKMKIYIGRKPKEQQ